MKESWKWKNLDKQTEVHKPLQREFKSWKKRISGFEDMIEEID